MKVSMKAMLNKAFEQKYAVGQFNIHNLEWTKAVLKAAQEESSPVILGVSGGTVPHMGGFKTINAVVDNLMSYMNISVPVALHLDHGQSFEACKQAIDAGFTSVMYDGSHLPFIDNKAISEQVVAYAKPYGVSVEVELGTIAGSEDGIQNSAVIYADPNECLLLSQIGIDALAPALGSTHGMYKGKAKLGFAEMEHIAKITGIPLVLHGGTGISDDDMRHAISLGTAKINVNTENMYAWCERVRALFAERDNLNDPRKIINIGCEVVTDNIRQKMRLFGSSMKG